MSKGAQGCTNRIEDISKHFRLTGIQDNRTKTLTQWDKGTFGCSLNSSGSTAAAAKIVSTIGCQGIMMN